MRPPEVIVFVFLFYAACVDVRTFRIDPVVTAVTALTGAVFAVTERLSDPAGIALSLLPGAILFLFALISRGGFGPGDGLTLMVTGLFVDVQTVLVTVAAGVAFSACFAGGYLVFVHFGMQRRLKGKTFPFLPFVLAGFALSLIWS